MKGKFDYGIPDKIVENSPHMMRYWKDHASYPFQSHDLWFLTEDTRWGKYESGFDTKSLIKKVNREDLWRDAAKSLGVAAADIPTSTSRGQEKFFDGKIFDPENPAAYLKSLTIKRVEVCRQDAPARAANLSEIERRIHAMNMPVVRSDLMETVTTKPDTAAVAKVLALTPKRPGLKSRVTTALGNAAVRIVPPLLVIALLLAVWELLCRKAGATLPPAFRQSNSQTASRAAITSQGGKTRYSRISKSRGNARFKSWPFWCECQHFCRGGSVRLCRGGLP